MEVCTYSLCYTNKLQTSPLGFQLEILIKFYGVVKLNDLTGLAGQQNIVEQLVFNEFRSQKIVFQLPHKWLHP